MSDRLAFPPAKAAKLPFPPGCSVSVVGGGSAGATAAAADAIVQSAYIDLSASDRTTHYEVLPKGDRTTNAINTTVVVSEGQLRYGIDCPVQILSPAHGAGDSPRPGIIISRPYGGDPPMYSAEIVAGNRRGEVIHSLTRLSIRYRHSVEMLGGKMVGGKMVQMSGAAPSSSSSSSSSSDDDDDDDGYDHEKNAASFAVPTEVIVPTAASGNDSKKERKGAADSNSLDGSMLLSGEFSPAHFGDDGGDDLHVDGIGKDATRIPRKSKKPRAEDDKENGHPNTPVPSKRMKMDDECLREESNEVEQHVERLRIPSFIDVNVLRRQSWKLKQLGDETRTAVEIEIVEEGQIFDGCHHADGAVYITVTGAEDSWSDVPSCCWGVEDMLYESLPDCLRRPLLFDIMVLGRHGIFDASRVPWEGRTPGTTNPLIVYVERGPDFIRPKTWLGITSIPFNDIGGGDWRDSVYSLLLGPRGRKHQELLRKFAGSRISVVLRECAFPHVSIEAYSKETLIAAMYHIRGELKTIMKK